MKQRKAGVADLLGFSLLCLMPLAAAPAASGATYWVAVDGSPLGDGTRDKPWPSVQYGLEKVGGGNTILLKPGIYHGPLLVDKQYGGTRERPTVIKSEVKWKATVMGGDPHAIYTLTDHVVIDGFEAFGARFQGVKLIGNYNTVRNCWIHNNTDTGVAMHHFTGGVIENNLIEFNGSHIWLHHGVYADGVNLTVRGNIVRHNSGWGLHLYPEIARSVIANNLVYDQAHGYGIIVACPAGGGKNLIVNNTVAGCQGALNFSHGDGEVAVNNILVDRYSPVGLYECRKVFMDYNLCWPQGAAQGAHSVTGDPMFVDATHGCYWLKEGSPAIGKGTSENAPETDFWGRPAPRDTPRDLGAFAFVPYLATKEARKDWYSGWAYSFYPSKGYEMPDLWTLPPGAQ